MLCEQVSGKLHDFDTTGKTLEFVDIEWHEAFKKIHKKTTDKGTEVGIRMDDSVLARGLYQDCLLYTSILAIGMTYVIITGGIDLSVGSVAGLAGMIAGGLIQEGLTLKFAGVTVYFSVPLVCLLYTSRCV